MCTQNDLSILYLVPLISTINLHVFCSQQEILELLIFDIEVLVPYA